LYFLAPKCLCRGTSCERGKQSQVSKESENVEVLFVIIIVPLGGALCLLFYRLKWRPRGKKTLGRCLGGEGSVGTAEVVVATCLGNGRPSPGYRGDVDVGMVRHLGCCGGRAIPCSQRASVVPLLTGGGRGRVRV
jgi:hypothetical protein